MMKNSEGNKKIAIKDALTILRKHIKENNLKELPTTNQIRNLRGGTKLIRTYSIKELSAMLNIGCNSERFKSKFNHDDEEKFKKNFDKEMNEELLGARDWFIQRRRDVLMGRRYKVKNSELATSKVSRGKIIEKFDNHFVMLLDYGYTESFLYTDVIERC